MRKILTVLLTIALLVSSTVFAMAESPDKTVPDTGSNTQKTAADTSGNGGGAEERVLDITHVDAEQVITYGWDLTAELTADRSGNIDPLTGLYLVSAVRREVSDELLISMEADIYKETTLDTITVVLGDESEDGTFEAVKTYQLTEFYQYTESGVTSVELDLTVDLTELYQEGLSLPEKVRLIIPAEGSNGGSNDLIATHGLSIPVPPFTVNAEAVIQTDLLDVLADLGTVELQEDDWSITETDLGEDNTFRKETAIAFNDSVEARDLTVTASLIGDGQVVLDTVVAALSFGEGGNQGDQGNQGNQSDQGNQGDQGDRDSGPSEPPMGNYGNGDPQNPEPLKEEALVRTIWDGGFQLNHGFWMPPVTDNFVLERRAVSIRFWLQEEPEEIPVIYFFKTDDPENISMDNYVGEITQDGSQSGNSGRHSKNCAGNLPGAYYKFKLKARNLDFLDEGETYVLAVMSGGKLLYFSENQPATLSFSIGEGALHTGQNNKRSLRDTGSKKNLSPRRSLNNP